jgi:hypothetical protein
MDRLRNKTVPRKSGKNISQNTNKIKAKVNDKEENASGNEILQE